MENDEKNRLVSLDRSVQAIGSRRKVYRQANGRRGGTQTSAIATSRSGNAFVGGNWRVRVVFCENRLAIVPGPIVVGGYRFAHTSASMKLEFRRPDFRVNGWSALSYQRSHRQSKIWNRSATLRSQYLPKQLPNLQTAKKWLSAKRDRNEFPHVLPSLHRPYFAYTTCVFYRLLSFCIQGTSLSLIIDLNSSPLFVSAIRERPFPPSLAFGCCQP